MSKGNLKPEDELCLRTHYQYLTENLEASDLVEFLFVHYVITLDDKNKICKRKTRSKRNKVLLDFLLHHGRKEDFNIFLQSLELEYKHVSQYLQEKALTESDRPSQQRSAFVRGLLRFPARIKKAVISSARRIYTTPTDTEDSPSSERAEHNYSVPIPRFQYDSPVKVPIPRFQYDSPVKDSSSIPNIKDGDDMYEDAYCVDCVSHSFKDYGDVYINANVNADSSSIQNIKDGDDMYEDPASRQWWRRCAKSVRVLEMRGRPVKGSYSIKDDDDAYESIETYESKQISDYIQEEKHKFPSLKELYCIENTVAEEDISKVVPDVGIKSKTMGAESSTSTECENQDRHKEYIDINSLKKENLPHCYQHDEMLHLIKSLADLTVKIKVKNVQEQFKQFWKTKHENSFLSRLGSSDTLLASGKVDEVFYRTEKDGPCECPCIECKAVPKNEWGEVRILTSAHLAYDDEDATHFKCTLFYDDDSEKDKAKSLIGSKVVVFNAKNDVCMFICKTCDLDLIRTLDGMLDNFVKCWENAFDKFSKTVKWEKENLICIVSHPHGGQKKISLGKRIMEKNNLGSTRLNYDTPTCVGSTGAYVLAPDFDVSDDIMS